MVSKKQGFSRVAIRPMGRNRKYSKSRRSGPGEVVEISRSGSGQEG